MTPRTSLGRTSLVACCIALCAQAIAFCQTGASAGDGTEAARSAQEERRAVEMLEQQRDIEIELAVGSIRLKTLTAQSLLLDGQHTEALLLADELMTRVDRLPDAPDRVDRKLLEAPLREIIHEATGRTTDLQKQHLPERYRPMRSLTTLDEELARDAERLLEEGDARRSYKADEADQLLAVEQSRRIPRNLLTYPPNWPQITQKRSANAGGAYYKGPVFRDVDGQLKYTAIYDINELLMEIPDYTAAPEMDLAVVQRNAGDRDVLRYRSRIFSGTAADLADGLPLLRFFGGVDDSRVGTSHAASQASFEELSRMIEQVLDSRAAQTGP